MLVGEGARRMKLGYFFFALARVSDTGCISSRFPVPTE